MIIISTFSTSVVAEAVQLHQFSRALYQLIEIPVHRSSMRVTLMRLIRIRDEPGHARRKYP